MQNNVVCFGEMLLDCFPDKIIPGGAPMNVALHLKQLGLDVYMLSKVGEDKNGQLLLDFVKSFGLKTEGIQIDPIHPTGTVVVDNSDIENIKYEIVAPVAWDFIEENEQNRLAVENAQAFIYGSLAIRNSHSWECLQKLLLATKALKIFDINIRPPFVDFQKINWLLNHTDILKINEDELKYLSENYNMSSNIADFCSEISQKFHLQMICVTLGAKGAMIYKHGQMEYHSGYKVKVEDTVGSGDAFLSGLVKNHLESRSMSEILNFACGLGALVASKKGGTPKYNLEEVNELINTSSGSN